MRAHFCFVVVDIHQDAREHQPMTLDAAKKAKDRTLKSFAPKTDGQIENANLKKDVRVDPKAQAVPASKAQSAKL